jgi:rhodanese-related sulfurtransferase
MSDKTARDITAEAKQAVPTLSLTKAKHKYDQGAIFLDVREVFEWWGGRVQNAVHIPRGLLEWRAANRLPDKACPIVAYCASGARSALAAARLQEMGYHDVSSMNAGYKAWRKAGYPVERTLLSYLLGGW